MIHPTIGRKVWFHPAIAQMETVSDNGNFSRRVYLINRNIAIDPRHIVMDATIVYVHDDRRVNLLVTDHCGHQHQLSTVKLVQDGDDFDPLEAYCKWPLYQVGQAKADERKAAPSLYKGLAAAAPAAAFAPDAGHLQRYMKAGERGPATYTDYADILIAIARGDMVEWRAPNGEWTYQHPSHTLNEIKGRIWEPGDYRVKAAQGGAS